MTFSWVSAFCFNDFYPHCDFAVYYNCQLKFDENKADLNLLTFPSAIAKNMTKKIGIDDPNPQLLLQRKLCGISQDWFYAKYVFRK